MPAEMDLRQKCHRYILTKDKQYRAFESIHMNETSGEVTMKWIARDGMVHTTKASYGSMK